jgi:hypothetical protein
LWEKKDKHCDPAAPADQQLGSWWDHVLLDAESKLIVTLKVGRRTLKTTLEAFADYYARTDGYLPELITTDEYAAYDTALVQTYGVPQEEFKRQLTAAEREELAGVLEEMPPVYIPEEIGYATVPKERAQGRVVRVAPRVVLGTEKQMEAVLAEGTTAPTINVSYVERSHGTQRHCNARKARKVYTFSKEWLFPVAVTWLCVVAYNWCWAPRTLREPVQAQPPRYRQRTPAMVAGLAEESWTLHEVLAYRVYPKEDRPKKRKRRRRKGKRVEGR